MGEEEAQGLNNEAQEFLKSISDSDQLATAFKTVAASVFTYYDELIKQGFPETQATLLTIEFQKQFLSKAIGN